jgi:diacylglycerol O-acyltransferase / wax synthase
MAHSHYERLSALDATFLEVEDANAHMHVGAVSLFDAAPLMRADGAIDIDRIRRLVEVAVHHFPRYRQRLATIPLFGHPAWVDDATFNLTYHVRHVSLPKPGEERLLKRLAGRIMSQQLDRGKPLWELWVVEGVEGDRIALITKAHHCMIDGVGSVELTGAFMRATPDLQRAMEEPPRWVARPAPTPFELLLGELQRRAAEPLAALDAARRVLSDPGGSLRGVRDAVVGLGEAIGAGMRPASPTPLNLDIGPHRRFDWLEMDLNAVKEIKTRLGGTVNDVVLGIVSGALARFLHGRGQPVEHLDFRAMIPVNVRTETTRESLGNQVSMMVARLPLEERDPRRRLQRVIEATGTLKRSKQALGVQTLEEISDWTLTTLFAAFARLSTLSRPYNIVVTNVPGPQFATYFLGAETRAVYPLVPLNRNQALGIALFSYNAKLFWGFNSDWDVVPDLHDLVEATRREFELLRDAAAQGPLSVPRSEHAGSAAKRARRRSADPRDGRLSSTYPVAPPRPTG